MLKMDLNEELMTDEEFERLCLEFGIQNSPSVLVVSRVGRPRKYEFSTVLSLRLPADIVKRYRRYCKDNAITPSDLFVDFVKSL